MKLNIQYFGLYEDLPSTKTPITAESLNRDTVTLGLGSDTYDNTSTYAVGDMVIYNNVIYECNTAITTAEDFDSTKWTIVPIIVDE